MNEKKNKLIHIRLPQEIYKKLKGKCVSESLCMQDFLVDMIAENVTEHSLQKKLTNGNKPSKLSILNLLSQCPTLKDIDLSELKRLARTATYYHYNKGRIIAWEEGVCDSLKIVACGSVKVFKTSPSGREIVVEVLGKGEIFGAMTLITGSSSYSVGAQAMEETDIISIPKEKLLDIFSHNPQVWTKISILAKVRFSTLLDKLVSMVTYTAEQRVFKVLTELLHKYGNTLHFTHKEIAEMSATTHETVSRVMTGLQNRGAVRLSRGQILIVNKDQLSF